MQKREREVAELNTATVKLKDELLRKTKETEKAVQKARTSSLSLAPASERESELQEEVAKLNVRDFSHAILIDNF